MSPPHNSHRLIYGLLSSWGPYSISQYSKLAVSIVEIMTSCTRRDTTKKVQVGYFLRVIQTGIKLVMLGVLEDRSPASRPGLRQTKSRALQYLVRPLLGGENDIRQHVPPRLLGSIQCYRGRGGKAERGGGA